MKTVNKICRILAVAFGLVSVVLFFTNLVTVTVNGSKESILGAVMAFGAEKTLTDGTVVEMANSVHTAAIFWLTVIATVMSGFAFKGRKLRYGASGVALIAAIYALVEVLGKPQNFFDLRTTTGVALSDAKYTVFAVLLVVALFVFTAFAVAYLLIDDALEVAGGKRRFSIPRRVIQFFRDYKSEVKKIVWPGLREVLKNTGIVLIMCLLVGALIWIVDLGLGALLDVILK